MALIKGNHNNQCWWGCGKTRTLIHCWWECQSVQSLWKAVWRFLKKLKIELPYDPVILLLGIYPKERRSYGNNPGVLQLMNGSRKYGIYTQWGITQP
jgi:hypothetical protein